MIDDDTLSVRARHLAAAIEPFAAQVYFASECHESYAALGFGPSPGVFGNRVQLPDGPAYFCSRGSALGDVPGEVVAAAFGVFDPLVVVPAVAAGRRHADAATLAETRAAGATVALARMLGPRPAGIERATELLQRAVAPLRPEGRPLYAGLSALGLPGDPVGDAWRLADRLREYRGDAHTAAWISAGFDATEIGLATELYWGLPMRTYVRTRGWSDAALDEAEERMRGRGLVAHGALSPAGRIEREAVEVATDRQCRPILEALGDDLETLLAVLEPWSAAVRRVGGYPPSGPHDLAHAAGARGRTAR